MIERSSNSVGKYISVHLRFEEVHSLFLVLLAQDFLRSTKSVDLQYNDATSILHVKDMVAFSCCIYDGGQAEKSEMDVVREKGWGKKFKQKYRVIAPGLNRKNGKCPMTPVEVRLY